jgi:four helix bundle protein
MRAEQDNKGLETLQIWQRTIEFTVRICKEVIPKLPPEEKWNLSHQIRRSVQSIPANIAEGYGRYHYLDNIRFCYIARGSLEETFSHLVIAYRLKYIPDPLYQDLAGEMTRIRQMLNGYIGFLKKGKTGENEFPGRLNLREETNTYDAYSDEQNELPNNELPNNEPQSDEE